MSLDNRSQKQSDRITISLKRPSSNPPAGPADLVVDQEGETNSVSAFVILPDGSKNSLGIFTPETTIAELIKHAKRTGQ